MRDYCITHTNNGRWPHILTVIMMMVTIMMMAYITGVTAVCPSSTLRIGVLGNPSVITSQTLARLDNQLRLTAAYGFGSCTLTLITCNVTVTASGAYLNDGNQSESYDIAILPPLWAYALRTSTIALYGTGSAYPLLSLVRSWSQSVLSLSGGVIIRSASSSSIFSSITRLDQFAALAILNIVPTLCMTNLSPLGGKYSQIQQLLSANINYTRWNIITMATPGGVDDNIVNAVVAGTCPLAFVRTFTVERMIANGQLSSGLIAVIGDRRADVITATNGEWPSDVAISTNTFPIFSVMASSSMSTTMVSAVVATLLSDTGMHGYGTDTNTSYSWSLPVSEASTIELASDLQIFSFATCAAGSGRDASWPYMCKTCSIGYWSSAVGVTCELCPLNTYSNTTGATYCLPCHTTTIGVSQCAQQSSTGMIIVTSSGPFFWTSSYAPLTVALAIFTMVALIIGITCCILWRRRRHQEKTFNPTKSYRLSAPPSAVSGNENGISGNGNGHGGAPGGANGHRSNGALDAFSQAISPIHRHQEASHSPTTSGHRATKSHSPAVTVWHDRIRTGMFAEPLPPTQRASNGHETSVTVIDDAARGTSTPAGAHHSIHYTPHRSSTSGVNGGLLSERDLLSPVLGEGNKQLSRAPSQAIGIDTLNHVIQLRESMTSPLSPNLVPAMPSHMAANLRAALGYDHMSNGNGNNGNNTTNNNMLSAPIVGPGEIPSPNVLPASPHRSGSRNRLRMQTSSTAPSHRISLTEIHLPSSSLTIHTGNHSPQHTPRGHVRTMSTNLSLLAATREAAAIAAAEQLVISSLKGEHASSMTTALQSPPSPPPPASLERRPSGVHVFDRRPSGASLVPPGQPSPTTSTRAPSTSNNGNGNGIATNGNNNSPRVLHASQSSTSPIAVVTNNSPRTNGSNGNNVSGPNTNTSNKPVLGNRVGSRRPSASANMVPLTGITLPLTTMQPISPPRDTDSPLAVNRPALLSSNDNPPMQLVGHPGMTTRKNSFNHLSAVAAVLAAATAASSVADIIRPVPTPKASPPSPVVASSARNASHHNVVTARDQMVQSPSASLESQSSSNKQVMISYSHKDQDFAKKVAAALKEAEFKVWIDTDITPGEDWRSDIAHAIEGSFAIVFILSPYSVASKYCKEEIYYATNLKRHVFPIVYSDCFKHLRGGFKMLLQRIQWINFEQKGWSPALAQLLERLRAPPSEGKERPSSQFMPEEVTPLAELREHAQPVAHKEVYICYTENDPKDAALARRLYNDLKSSGGTVALSARPPVNINTNGNGNGSGSGSNTPLPGARRGSTAGPTRRQSSLSWDMGAGASAAHALVRRPSADLLALPSSGAVWPGSSLSSPVPASPRSAPLPTVTDDLWEQNAKEIDASAMILFIASEASLTSPECADEIHYAYESEKLIIQLNVRASPNDGTATRKNRSSFVMEGSMAMMLARTATVDFVHQSYDLSLLDISVMVTTVRREIARKHANAPVRSPPNVMRPRPWQHVTDGSTDSIMVKNGDGHDDDDLATHLQSRYHLPDRS